MQELQQKSVFFSKKIPSFCLIASRLLPIAYSLELACERPIT